MHVTQRAIRITWLCCGIIRDGYVAGFVPRSAKTGLAAGSPSLSIQHEVALTKVSASRFASVLRAIGRPKGRPLEFLRAHYNAPGRAASATVLAECVGYKSNNGIKSWYGTLARQIGMLIAVESPDISLLFDVVRPSTARSREWTFVMRPEFADGLKRAGWVTEPESGAVDHHNECSNPHC
jgi:hypothetical protein